MKQLEEQELVEVSGGKGKDRVTIKVLLVWKGEAENFKNRIPSLTVKCWDDDGVATATVNKQNDWTCKFRVLNHAEFHTGIDFTAYPFVKNVKYEWNQGANLVIYTIS